MLVVALHTNVMVPAHAQDRYALINLREYALEIDHLLLPHVVVTAVVDINIHTYVLACSRIVNVSSVIARPFTGTRMRKPFFPSVVPSNLKVRICGMFEIERHTGNSGTEPVGS